MPGVDGGTLYPESGLRRFTAALFEKVGVPTADAARTADNLIHANLRGVDTHGITRVLVAYVRRIQHALMLPRTEVEVVRERPATALIDGHNGVGQVIATRAMEMAIEKAAKCGSAFVGAFHSNHFGTCAYYSMMAVEHDMIGFCITNGPPAMAPWGGRDKLLSTSPISFAVPAGEERPFVVDLATTVVARGRIVLYAKQGLPIPEGWAVDAEGRPTTSAEAALSGLLAPMGGYKGYGLSLAVDLLAGVLTGANYGGHFDGTLFDYDRPPADVGSLFAAISVDAFEDVPAFKARVDQALREIKHSTRATGVERIYIPGEIEAECAEHRLREGIPIPDEVVRDFVELGEELGVPFPAAST
jgi:LDH2 family malate/lactate/ureidoglycolate dehydrogenase